MMLLVSRRVTGPLHQIQGAMLKLADGDFGVAVPGLERQDEIGAMANAVERFKVLADEQRAPRSRRGHPPPAGRERRADQGRGGARRGGRGAGAGRSARSAPASPSSPNGDLTFRLTDEFPEAYKRDQGRVQHRDRRSCTRPSRRSRSRPARSPTQRPRSRPAPPTCRSAPRSRRASLEQTSASMEEISVDGEEERRERPAGQPGHRRHRARWPTAAARWSRRRSTRWSRIAGFVAPRSPTSSA